MRNTPLHELIGTFKSVKLAVSAANDYRLGAEQRRNRVAANAQR